VSDLLKWYLAGLEKLREQRRVPGWQPEQDREILAAMEDRYPELTEEERQVVESAPDMWPETVEVSGG